MNGRLDSAHRLFEIGTRCSVSERSSAASLASPRCAVRRRRGPRCAVRRPIPPVLAPAGQARRIPAPARRRRERPRATDRRMAAHGEDCDGHHGPRLRGRSPPVRGPPRRRDRREHGAVQVQRVVAHDAAQERHEHHGCRTGRSPAWCRTRRRRTRWSRWSR
ncbi:hypothetical protein F9948_17715 [Burkholderia thailandensis]|nr:hypothetical protein [Burkholderia thailandensis]MDD1488484.1 hypothetical protein [Burkholderia thailandensis]MDD1492433.1 hypothetical protein [Burkholderia thailandensis]